MGLLDIKPHQVSRDLRGYSVFLYGAPKTGKTTIACQFPGALLLAFEKGYSTIGGVLAQPINSWSEFKKLFVEFKDPAVKERYQTIVIDTADIAYSYCEKYICTRESDASHSYQNVADIPYGKGYAMAMDEFDECIRKILQLGYGLVIISHDQDKTMKNENGEEYNQIIPTLDKRARLVCERTCDIIGYCREVEDQEGHKTVRMFMRETSRYVAGSRFKYTPDSIELSYDNLVKAIADAIDEQERVSKGSTTDSYSNLHTDDVEYDFPALMKEVQQTVGALMSGHPEMEHKIVSIVDKHLGKGKKVSDCTPDQAALVDLILYDLKHL